MKSHSVEMLSAVIIIIINLYTCFYVIRAVAEHINQTQRYLLRQLGTNNLKKVLCVSMFPSFPPETSHMMRTLSWKFTFEILRFPFDCTFILPTNGDRTAIFVDPAALTVAMRFQWLRGMDLLIYFHVTFPRRMLDLHFKVTSLPVKPYTLSPATEKSRII